MKFNKWTLGLAACAALAISLTGCATQSKSTKQQEPIRVAAVQTDNGTVLYPQSYFSVTNESGQVMVYPCYAAIINTNKPVWSLKRFLWDSDHTLLAFSDSPYEAHSGNGKALLVDSQYQQLDSEFNSGSRFSGSSKLNVGQISLTVNTNSITAVGNAGNQLIQGVGSAVGNVMSNAKK